MQLVYTLSQLIKIDSDILDSVRVSFVEERMDFISSKNLRYRKEIKIQKRELLFEL